MVLLIEKPHHLRPDIRREYWPGVDEGDEFWIDSI